MAADQFVVAHGVRLHWREWGGRARAALLILHGFSTHARTWDHVAEALGDRFRGTSDLVSDRHSVSRKMGAKPFQQLCGRRLNPPGW